MSDIWHRQSTWYQSRGSLIDFSITKLTKPVELVFLKSHRIYLVVKLHLCLWKILLISCLFVSAPTYSCVWHFINRFYKLQWGRQFRRLFIIYLFYLKIFYNGSPISHQQNCFPRGRSNSNITSMKIYTKVDLNYKLLQIYNKFVL
jgi:hypothetical protein